MNIKITAVAAEDGLTHPLPRTTAGRPRIELVVVDLDNTLYDWMAAFIPALYELALVASEILGADLEVLLDELREVHRLHADIEHPFALLETTTVRAAYGPHGRQRALAALDPAFLAFNRYRRRTLRFYDGVEATLRAIADAGVPIVGYTDARIVNASFRIRKLGLRRYLSRFYAPASLLGAAVIEDDFVRALAPTDRKPDPDILLRICSDHAKSPGRVLFVGDSLTRDVHMAVSAGCRAAWARYGTVHDPVLWATLLRVSHWTLEDVARERRLAASAAADRPDAVLDRFDELLDVFDIGGA
ncbi:HAD-IA family hydrolase [Beijerinckia sp. L45]|uniref:HAD-IA family hydrolase n=1 Tax=Beijerinckia sp. L45 TaxID=1641855 RepID=UPI00131BE385|nr:HAD-IA family hydrolase [Beijerinckia sp. L45]